MIIQPDNGRVGVPGIWDIAGLPDIMGTEDARSGLNSIFDVDQKRPSVVLWSSFVPRPLPLSVRDYYLQKRPMRPNFGGFLFKPALPRCLPPEPLKTR
jgi:hypothetical protein